MMSDKRFSWKTEKLQHSDNEVLMVVDNANKDWKGHILNIVDMLNELNDERMMYRTTIDKRIVELEEENEQLRKKNVFLAKQRNYWKSKCDMAVETFETDEATAKKISELEKQNEQLKSELNDCELEEINGKWLVKISDLFYDIE